MDKENAFTRDLLILVTGIAFIILANSNNLINSSMTLKILESLGYAMAGYAPIQLCLYLKNRFSESITKRSIDKLFESEVRQLRTKTDLPILIAADVEGCITPPHRTIINLRNFQRLRAYCEFVKYNPEYPQLIVFTGRSQGYVELLAQSLGIINSPIDLPFVIENGAALYFPTAKKTIPLINDEQLIAIHTTNILLNKHLPENEFEPKCYMVTINPNERQTVDELREQVTLILQQDDLLENLTVSSTASAVDVTPKNINKLSGIREVLKYFPKDRQEQSLKNIVGIGDHVSDLNLIKNVGRGYCPAQNVHIEVRNLVEEKFGKSNVINLPHIEFVINVIERECQLRII